MLVRVTIIGIFVTPSEFRCSSNSLAGDFGPCFAARLPGWLSGSLRMRPRSILMLFIVA